MSITRNELLQELNALLKPEAFRDYGPNGLQVQGKSEINTLVTGVTASQALIEKAIEEKADAILVHHGYFWKGEDPCLVGMKYQRIKLLIEHNLNLFGYHLPLDAHAEFGNNVQLAKRLGITVTGGLEPDNNFSVGNVGKLPQPMTVAELASKVAEILNREPLTIEGGGHPVETIAWCTGGAQGYIDQALSLGVDAYLSGEISEYTVHTARESGIHYIAAGHHATERYGVQAVGDYLAEKFAIKHKFIDIPNPV